jgi:hypothetical protein
MNLTGPLGKQYCAVFQFMALFSLFFATLGIIMVIYNLVRGKNIFTTLLSSIGIPVYLLMYIQNRLLYNICLQQ